MKKSRRAASGIKGVRVGITGHRPNRMPVGQWDRIKKDLAKVMAEIEVGRVGGRPVLLSGFAEGADRLAAFVALGRGWSLRAILAFHRTRFEADFPEPSAVGEFRALLAAAEAVEEPRKGAHQRKPDSGYDAVGEKLVTLSDMLIAVWDGEGSRGKGGTRDVIEQAMIRGVPVVWVHARKAQAPRRMQARHDAGGSERSVARRPRATAVGMR